MQKHCYLLSAEPPAFDINIILCSFNSFADNNGFSHLDRSTISVLTLLLTHGLPDGGGCMNQIAKQNLLYLIAFPLTLVDWKLCWNLLAPGMR